MTPETAKGSPGSETPASRPPRHQSPEGLRLRVFIRYATLTSIAGALIVLSLAAVFTNLGLLLLGVLLVGYVGVLVWARRQVERDSVQRAAVAICAGIWAIAIFLALFVSVPVLHFPLLLVLSIMVVLPYATKRALLRLIGGATLLAAVLTPVALLVQTREVMPFSLRGNVVPGWLLAAILMLIVPAVIGLILMLVWHYSAQLAETLAEAQAANRALRASERQLAAKVQELQESRIRIVQVQEGVRREMASYLHGRVQGRLLVLKHRLEERLTGTGSVPGEAGLCPDDVVDHLDRIIQQELSGLSRRLYPSLLRRGLVPALQSLGDEFEATLHVEMALDGRLVERERTDRHLIPESVRLAAYRVAEEALANVVKHAHASRVTVRLDLSGGGGLRLTVADNGRGFDAGATAGGLGLAVMHDYAGAVGGECVVHSAAGAGTEVVATLPVAGPGTAPPATAAPSG